ncbi:PAS domain S-box protein [Rhizobium sp. CG5]|uniref:PAS domain-containing sensor histidine kinase n=1 Tax=Rhizobium sp. CG5 TaxID=2726076 RepID=UPI0020338EAA|nr:ATP-binding protein [Rhizobium sp. CG5]MCM2472882.1 PAS domain S-box protein [Rhizobium sp. CG5]
MPAVQYPFIDIAVHRRVRDRFARGEALALFSADLSQVLWANGAGAGFFGSASIYDFLEQGPTATDVTFRQLETTVHQLAKLGDSRSLLVRVASGFQRVPVEAHVELIEIRPGEPVVLFSIALPGQSKTPKDCAQLMLTGFDDPDTHMAMLDGEGQVIAASAHFQQLGMTAHTAKTLVNLVGSTPERILKRPIPTGRGYLPAAIGKVGDAPALHLLFAVETILGTMDPTEGFERPDNAKSDDAPAATVVADEPNPVEDLLPVGAVPFTPEPDAPMIAVEAEADTAPETIADEPEAAEPAPAETTPDFSDVMQAIGGIEDIEQGPEEFLDDEPPVAAEDAPEADEHSAEPADDTVDDSVPNDDMPAAMAEDATVDEAVPTEADAVDGETETDPVEAWPAADNLADVVPVAAADEVSGDDGASDETDEVVQPAAEAATLADDTAQVEAETTSELDQNSFRFVPGSRASRFVWKIDAAGRFSEVSGEFAQTVGPRAADINGQAFGDLAALFNLDPDGKIAELLKKRDTWSGKTIYWPIEGTALMVPVDLAALPTYTRDRDFDGFRGFGIVRVADVVDDPNAVGLTFVPEETHSPAPTAVDAADRPAVDLLEAAPPAVEDADADIGTDDTDAVADADPVVETDQGADDAVTAVDETVEVSETPADPEPPEDDEPDLFQTEPTPRAHFVAAYEPPALQIVETPNRRSSDKIIQLEERRFKPKDGLTPGEQAAFREIARKLDPHGLSGLGSSAVGSEAPPTEPDEDEMLFEAGNDNDGTTAPAGGAAEQASSDESDTAVAVLDERAEQDGGGPQTETGRGTASETFADPQGEVVSLPRAKREIALTADILDMMPVPLLVHLGDRLIHGNPEFLSLTGYDSIEALDEAGGLDALLQRDDLEDTTEQAGSLVVVRADDELVPVSARLQSIRWEQSSALLLALVPISVRDEASLMPAVATPVEPRPPAEADQLARLQVEAEELRAILETATDGVVILGADGDIRSMNRAASALFNYDDEETRGKPFVMLFAHESQKAILDYLSGLAGHGVASVLNDGREVIGREASGGFLPIFMTIGQLTSSNGYCAVIRDITQWKRTEEELRNAKRAAETANAHKSDFLARVSHEIRTPLNAIIGFADIMAGERFGPIGHPRYVEYSNDIGRSGRHVLDIVNDLLDISKIEAGEMELDFVAVGLNETVSEAVSIVQPQANGQRVIIRTALSQSVPNVVADLRSIKQIVLNILANAIRFTPSGGQIIVSTAYEGNGSVILRIRDTGVGMSRSELEQAMKPFRQVSAGPRIRGEGTGLGLPLTKAMVDANRATFAIHSSPNEGTLVEVTFPSPRVLAD